MRILLLGGINEAKGLVQGLQDAGHLPVYSIAGRVRQAELVCEQISGGFSQYCTDLTSAHPGVSGLTHWLRQQHTELVIDATHPYAEQISRHAVSACRALAIPCWRYLRPAWQSTPELPFQQLENWDALARLLPHFKKPVFTLGQIPAARLKPLPHQRWLVRSAIGINTDQDRIDQVQAIGPFSLAHEEQMFRLHRADLLVAKNSGGSLMDNKLKAAHQLGIPIILLQRPPLVAADREYSSPEALLNALERPPQ
ncbi:precorrin-6A/cobalt-precorrin-6A reductase [Aestuariirhabdus litorea]|uniref:Cobalt-precorrin-6A reductase n=1 Tax=Aestuariirhabdus litorea TaxID=2528527 RepID=A0A3P3VP30_9GAMM|nr:precorrin-6A/cobalt-precorrin-6A reductase [Aestuariirhabdus litorea]RRJ84521.1 cobalt-precorrin-6A reductase [Aestuariirhabdus litorea]RWW97746.1 cobalt-precorrin-6A reductase [Endozoicomonadaceae bacterium GTF-13]